MGQSALRSRTNHNNHREILNLNQTMNIFIIASVIFVGHARILFPFEQEILSREGLSAISFSFDDHDSERTSTETAAVEIETTEKPALTASCPEDAPWCDAPVEYPDNIILKAVNKQKKIVRVCLKTSLLLEEMLRLQRVLPKD